MSAVLGGGGRQTRGEKRQGSTIDSARGFKRPLMSPHQTSELELVHKEKPEEEGVVLAPVMPACLIYWPDCRTVHRGA